MMTRIFVLMGGTGHIGSALTRILLRKGHVVRTLGRNPTKLEILKAWGAEALAVSHEDPRALARAFQDADAVFTLIPPAFQEEDFGGYQDRVGEATLQALQESGVNRVLNLSSLGAQHAQGTGPIKGLHRQEKRLASLGGIQLLHLRAGYFMENLTWFLASMEQTGRLEAALEPDLPLWMVAAGDIALKAAELLEEGFGGRWLLEFAGPRPRTMGEAAAVLGRALGRPDLMYVQTSYEKREMVLLGTGMKPGSAALLVELDRACNQGLVAPLRLLGSDAMGHTELEAYAQMLAASLAAR